ncbi:alpha/beta hydrolase [Jeotgalibaca sp. MA1X17-3]|uniref:alpha/beta hydrolase n=1 Tax=Jeotgalibaca sp. MA1X17-3 TaxID=2908211 RepID=UPI001F40A268|nr:alpha/beta hydrolase [Jeotgalibaca sp. MA1X17-3]UJF15442.1 alpha/beta hydrolase [Jeotgalibaca sp. MA1X17-3]
MSKKKKSSFKEEPLKEKNKYSKTSKIFLAIGFMLFLLFGIVLGYLSDYYKASDEALAALQTTQTVEVSGEDPIIFRPEKQPEDEIGIIFYPGGKVDEKAYAPIMKQLAKEGYTVFVASVPFHLAVFDSNAAEGIIEDHPEIKEWYLAGHSLGGAMAAAYTNKTTQQIEGLILLAAYSANDLSSQELPVIIIYGSHDEVLDVEKLKENQKNLPLGAKEYVLEGGNHALFGNYGFQEGDGEATISASEQQEETVELIHSFIHENNK